MTETIGETQKGFIRLIKEQNVLRTLLELTKSSDRCKYFQVVRVLKCMPNDEKLSSLGSPYGTLGKSDIEEVLSRYSENSEWIMDVELINQDGVGICGGSYNSYGYRANLEKEDEINDFLKKRFKIVEYTN
ncbi:hypothetical protein J4407_03105 [Candidatus Pacearchaeota archaeon]|nr:hypothetical protein [Candidatus Pacearchaeota archaeon]